MLQHGDHFRMHRFNKNISKRRHSRTLQTQTSDPQHLQGAGYQRLQQTDRDFGGCGVIPVYPQRYKEMPRQLQAAPS